MAENEIQYPLRVLTFARRDGYIDETLFALGPSTFPEDSEEENTAVWKPGRAEWYILGCLFIVNIIVALDGAMLITALPFISITLEGSATEAFWVGTSYLTANAVVQPFIGRLSDVFGRRSLLLISLAFFTIGTTICAVAQDFSTLLAGRGIQGSGGGGCVCLTHIIISDVFPLRQRATYQSSLAVAWAVSTISGPFIGGVFAETPSLSWRFCFYITLPICGIAFMFAAIVIQLDLTRSDESFAEKMGKLDWLGGACFAGSVTSFLTGITQAGSLHPWSSPRVLALVIIGLLSFIATISWEIWGTKKPFLRLHLFRSRTANAGYCCAFVQGLVLLCITYYLPFYFQTCKGQSASRSGLSFMPFAGSMVVAVPVVSFMMSYTGNYRWAAWLGFSIAIMACGLMSLFDGGIRPSQWIIILIVGGIGQGTLFNSIFIAVQAAAPQEDVSYAAVNYTFMRSFGTCFGVAIGGTVFQNGMVRNLRKLQLPTQVGLDAESFVPILKGMPADSPLRESYVLAYSRSFREVWQTLTGILVAGLIVSLLMKGQSLDKILRSDHVVRRRLQRGSIRIRDRDDRT